MGDRYKNYVSVAERVAAATPHMQTVVAEPPVLLTETMGYMRVTVALDDGRSATGTASFRLDLTGKSAQATNPIEDCETSAIGRALGLLGYYSDRSIASAEEVAEAQLAAEYRQRFYAKFGAVAGTTWPMVAAYLELTDAPEPTTRDGWVSAGRAVAERQKRAEYDAVESST